MKVVLNVILKLIFAMAVQFSCLTLLVFVTLLLKAFSLDNGLALTPPMGWMAWERFRCNVDCEKDPNNCINEKLFMEMADRMVADGYLEAGYQFVCIDDCWMAKERLPNGQLQADPKRFPHGIKALASYIHSKGLKFGIYADFGTHTCQGYPGSINYLKQDMELFASWGADYLKLDGCYARPSQMDVGYPQVSRFLNETGRKIVFSCSWPFYHVFEGLKPNYEEILKYCNLWRNYIDINVSWQVLTNIIDYYAENQKDLIRVAGPGHWNDPDQLLIGNFGLSFEQSRAQFAFWAILASPLFMSNDLRNISPWAKEILQNKEIIAVNQDKLGVQGRRVLKNTGRYPQLKQFTEVWARQLSNGSVAVVLFNRRYGQPVYIEASFQIVGISTPTAKVRDLFEHKDLGIFKGSFTARVNPNGVVMVTITPPDITCSFKL